MREPDERDRFWSKVDKNGTTPESCPGLGPCWVWTACRHRNGYGSVLYRSTCRAAHRVAFFLAHGRWPEPCALHHCDNRACVNPEHLFEGTYADNAADREAKGRGRPPRGERSSKAKLTAQQVRDIRANAALCRVTQIELGERYGVSHSTISVIVRRERWTHI
jgi:hypothetical protein